MQLVSFFHAGLHRRWQGCHAARPPLVFSRRAAGEMIWQHLWDVQQEYQSCEIRPEQCSNHCLAMMMRGYTMLDYPIYVGLSQSIPWESYQRSSKSCGSFSTPFLPRFSFSKCPFCIKAKKELNDMGVPFTALDLDQMDQEDTPSNFGSSARKNRNLYN